MSVYEIDFDQVVSRLRDMSASQIVSAISAAQEVDVLDEVAIKLGELVRCMTPSPND